MGGDDGLLMAHDPVLDLRFHLQNRQLVVKGDE